MPQWEFPRMFAGCRVTAQVGPVFAVNQGFRAVTRAAAGTYDVTVEQNIDATQVIALATNVGTEPAVSTGISVSQTSDTTFRVTTSDGAALADISFWLVLFSTV